MLSANDEGPPVEESDDDDSLKGSHFPPDIILMGVRWYLAYPLSYRHVEELMAERGVELDHATIQRWVIKYTPLLEEAFHQRKRPVWTSWRLDETSIKVKGVWKYLYRAVDKYGKTIDFLLPEQRDEAAAKRFLTKAIRRHGGVPETITIDGSAANEAAIKSDNAEHGTAITIRKTKYLSHYRGARSQSRETGDPADVGLGSLRHGTGHPHRYRVDTFGWLSKIAFKAGVGQRVHARRRPQRHAARARGVPGRQARAGAAHAPTTWRRSSTPAAPPGAARARC